MKSTFASMSMIFGTATSMAAAADQQVATVQDYLPKCEKALRLEANKTGEDWFDVAECLGMMRGLNSLMRWNCASIAEGFRPIKEFTAKPLNPAASVQAFVNWARSDPDKWDLDVVSGAVIAIHGSFPCKN